MSYLEDVRVSMPMRRIAVCVLGLVLQTSCSQALVQEKSHSVPDSQERTNADARVEMPQDCFTEAQKIGNDAERPLKLDAVPDSLIWDRRFHPRLEFFLILGNTGPKPASVNKRAVRKVDYMLE